MYRFAAIDFETANDSRDSACAVGVVVVEKGRIAARHYSLIRPPSREFAFTHIHGLTWEDVAGAPAFTDLWPRLAREIGPVAFLAAHNATFDRGVLHRCCADGGFKIPAQRFVCTVQLARQTWSIFPTKLPDVCARLGIPLVHHRADSDAEACARIVLAAASAGWTP